MQSLPQEILSLILGHLIELPNPSEPQGRDNVDDLCNARLVCRQWNRVATTQVFQTVLLAYMDAGFDAWNGMLDSTVAKKTARRVCIRTAPPDDHPEGIWNPYEEGDYHGFLESIGRITELGGIKALYLRFSRFCGGVDSSVGDEVVEDIQTRQKILETVFKAIHQRHTENPGVTSIIRSLTIENLQNVPLPEFTSTDLFKAVTEDIEELHLMVTEESDEAGTDWDLFRAERQTFPPYLKNHWLAPMSSHLVSLTLYFRNEWGTVPGYFDGRGLSFPKLEKLTLGHFVIGHHAHFDWITDQGSLKCLYLDKCSIVSYLAMDRRYLHDWDVQSHDWHEYPTGSFGIDHDMVVYGFSGAWETIFDRIRTDLPNLMDFRFHHDGWDVVFPVRWWELTASLSKKRYSAFEEGWGDVKSDSGMMTFGDSDGWGNYGNEAYLNRSKETAEGDGQALEALLAEIRERQK